MADRFGSILRVEPNRPARKNAMTSGMYLTLAAISEDAAQDEGTRVVLWHGAGDSFCAGNDVANRRRQVPAVSRDTPSSSAIAQLLMPSAASSTICARIDRIGPCHLAPPHAHFQLATPSLLSTILTAAPRAILEHQESVSD